MKTNFNSRLFEKQIDLKKSAIVYGGGTGCQQIENTHENGSNDTRTTNYDENGHVVSIFYCTY